MKKINKKYFENPERYIPKGIYCYEANGLSEDGKRINNFKICPFWDIDEDKPKQYNGYCHYLKKGDWDLNPWISEHAIFYNEGVTQNDIKDLPLSILWDMCKMCDINDDITDEDIERLVNYNHI